jgi:hypothetical protein
MQLHAADGELTVAQTHLPSMLDVWPQASAAHEGRDIELVGFPEQETKPRGGSMEAVQDTWGMDTA